MEVQKIEHYAVGEITKASVVDNQALSCIDHLQSVSTNSRRG